MIVLLTKVIILYMRDPVPYVIEIDQGARSGDWLGPADWVR